MAPSKLYAIFALLAKHINDKNSKFICVIARGKDGKYEIYNSDVVDFDDLVGAANVMKEYMEDFKNNLDG